MKIYLDMSNNLCCEKNNKFLFSYDITRLKCFIREVVLNKFIISNINLVVEDNNYSGVYFLLNFKDKQHGGSLYLVKKYIKKIREDKLENLENISNFNQKCMPSLVNNLREIFNEIYELLEHGILRDYVFIRKNKKISDEVKKYNI